MAAEVAAKNVLRLRVMGLSHLGRVRRLVSGEGKSTEGCRSAIPGFAIPGEDSV